ncbi:MAG: pyridoxal phosphate-dependent aminotransferase [Nitrospirae bacterium]|nr:MAG: pyridoxal phosphate-dependent aminotransferase [Nitrospirota bacterium]
MKLAARIARIGPSPTLHITATAKAMTSQGLDVVDFAAGEPAWDTPDFVKAAAKAAIDAGFTKYTPVGGIPELKAAIVHKLARDHGVQYDPSQIIVSCGAKHALYNLAQVLFDPGDEVIIPAPYWVSYPEIVRLADATPVFLPTQESMQYAIDPKALEACITPQTKALILNSPCNPTGTLYTRQTLEAVATIALRHNLIIISDEIYETLVYDGAQHISPISLTPDLLAQTVVVNGVSKSFAMTGWRIGYAAGPQDIITAMTHLQSQSTSNPSSIAQKAALAALQSDGTFCHTLVADLIRKRDFMIQQLNTMPGITCPLPSGTFYAFPNVSALLGRESRQGPLHTPSDLATYLLHEAHVACVPGEPFGATQHLRLSYTGDWEVLKRGLARMEAAIRALT